LRSGFFSFQAATSASTIPALPPERSHITRSWAWAAIGNAISSAANAAAVFNLGKFIGFLPRAKSSAGSKLLPAYQEKLFSI
jgi:hypothetical protein